MERILEICQWYQNSGQVLPPRKIQTGENSEKAQKNNLHVRQQYWREFLHARG